MTQPSQIDAELRDTISELEASILNLQNAHNILWDRVEVLEAWRTATNTDDSKQKESDA